MSFELGDFTNPLDSLELRKEEYRFMLSNIIEASQKKGKEKQDFLMALDKKIREFVPIIEVEENLNELNRFITLFQGTDKDKNKDLEHPELVVWANKRKETLTLNLQTMRTVLSLWESMMKIIENQTDRPLNLRKELLQLRSILVKPALIGTAYDPFFGEKETERLHEEQNYRRDYKTLHLYFNRKVPEGPWGIEPDLNPEYLVGRIRAHKED